MTKYALSTMNDSIKYRSVYFIFHVIPGAIFIMPGLWLAYNVFRRYYRSVLSEGREPFESRLWYPGPIARQIPVESAMRGAICLYGAVDQVYQCCYRFEDVFPERLQHAVLFLSMSLAGIFEVAASFRRDSSSTSPRLLPPGVDRAASLLAAAITFLVFHFHFHNEVAIQVHMHGYYDWLTVAVMVSHVAEVLGRYRVWMALLRPYFLFLTGAWCLQISFVLYFPIPWPRNWEDASMASSIMVDFIMCCHLVMTFITFLTMAMFVRRSEMARHHKYFMANNNIEENSLLFKDNTFT